MAMGIWRNLKRQARAAVAPLVFLSLTGYFLWHATQGDRGLVATEAREQDLVLARAQLARAEEDVALWERRVAALNITRLDTDVLDERARAMLNLSDPADIVVLYKDGQRLF